MVETVRSDAAEQEEGDAKNEAGARRTEDGGKVNGEKEHGHINLRVKPFSQPLPV